MDKYKRLILLAEETDTPSTKEKIIELNKLLSEINHEKIQSMHYSLLDDLISILFNTNNIFMETEKRIDTLQTYIRDQDN
jgi:hypothetical protein